MQAYEKNLNESRGSSLVNNIITGGEKLLSLYVPYSKPDSKEWGFPDEKQPKMFHSGQSH